MPAACETAVVAVSASAAVLVAWRLAGWLHTDASCVRTARVGQAGGLEKVPAGIIQPMNSSLLSPHAA